jgi:hypothetical protein
MPIPMKEEQQLVNEYRRRIGRNGGLKSRRHLSSSGARNMVRLREARRACRKFHAQCFWYLREDMKSTREDIPEIVRGLRNNGGRQGYFLAEKLCR